MISPSPSIELWAIERLAEYPRNPRKNDSAVDRLCGSIREFGLRFECWPAATARSLTVTCG